MRVEARIDSRGFSRRAEVSPHFHGRRTATKRMCCRRPSDIPSRDNARPFFGLVFKGAEKKNETADERFNRCETGRKKKSTQDGAAHCRETKFNSEWIIFVYSPDQPKRPFFMCENDFQ